MLFRSFFAFQLISGDSNRRRNTFLAGSTLLVFFVIPMMIRYWYFNDILPNTYYLKLTGYPVANRLLTGLVSTLRFVFRTNWIAFLFPLTLIFTRRGNKTISLIACLIAAQLCYNIYVGGDVWDPPVTSRYLTPVMPLFFIAFSFAVLQARKSRVILNSLILSSPITSGLVFLFALINFNLEPSLEAGKWLLWKPPFQAADNAFHVRQALDILRLTSREAKIGVCWAGIVPYFTDRYCIDLLGKTDRRIAHEQAHLLRGPGSSGALTFLPGHNKWDYAYSIGEFQPDVVTAIWPVWGDPIADELLRKYYTRVGTMYVKIGSSSIIPRELKAMKVNK